MRRQVAIINVLNSQLDLIVENNWYPTSLYSGLPLRETIRPTKGSRDHVSHFSEVPHRRTTIVSVSRPGRRSDSTQPPNANRQHSTGCASPTTKMRTYDDSFSGQKIYPGKVCLCPPGQAGLSKSFSDDPPRSCISNRNNEFAAYLYFSMRMAG